MVSASIEESKYVHVLSRWNGPTKTSPNPIPGRRFC